MLDTEQIENWEAIKGMSGREEILSDAISLTCGDRESTYGDPVENMQHIADIFNAWTGLGLTARNVAQLHICTKMARRTTTPDHRDSFVDDTAYVGIEYECAVAEIERQ